MSTRRAFLKAVTTVAETAGLGGLPGALAQTPKPGSERLGLKGYDPVAYFTLGKPTPGIVGLEYVWDGVRYRFANAQHLAIFRASPDNYAPQFGGSCAMNMANGNRLEADPSIWVISSGRLYVFAGQAGQARFRQDPEASAMKAAANWQSLKDKPSQ
ncbi:MAG: YHS domain protein [Alphaproteobacteria bacterium]|nr:YHS domain protein [Alphaproteobacteria bacterium]